MTNLDQSMPRNVAPPDSLGELGELGVLSKKRLALVHNKVQSGEYPSAFTDLIQHLVGERILTLFQSRMILLGRASRIVLGRYILLRPLARGAMGRVYKAYHRMLGRVVAVKLIASKAPSEKAISRFRREMRLVGRLNHPNIAVAYDADRSKGVFFLAMEYLSGLTLKDLLEAKGPLPSDEVIHYMAQAARGLAHAHARGIVHRDVKPANIWLSEGSQIKILDLGLGILMDETDNVAANEVGKLTGTAEYISPEQACQKPLDGRSDLYALGCTMYHLIQGRPPFADRSWMERLAIRVSGDHEPITHDLVDEPHGIKAVMAKLLAHNPDDRFQTGDEAAEALLALVSSDAIAADTAFPSTQEPISLASRRGERLFKAARSAFITLAVASILGFNSLALDPGAKEPLPAIASTQVARAIGSVDENLSPAETVTPSAVVVINTAQRIEPDPPRDAALRRETVEPSPSANWNARLELVRLTSLLPRDLRLVPLAFVKRSVTVPRMALVAGPVVVMPRDVTVGLDPAFASPIEARKSSHQGITLRTSLRRPEPTPATSALEIRDEEVQTAGTPVHDTFRAVEAWKNANSTRKSALGNDIEAPPGSIPPPPPTPIQRSVAPDRGPSAPSPAEAVALIASREPKTATIDVFLPDGKAELVVRGAVGRGNPDEWYGPKRVIHTPPLDGTTDYTVGAFWTDSAGKPSIRQKDFKVKPGQFYQVDLRLAVPTFTEISKPSQFGSHP